MNKYYGLIISFIAGISTLLGYFSIYIKGNKEKIISNSLAFSGGVMITLSLIDLIPSSVRNLNILYVIIFFIIGFICCIFIEKLLSKLEGLYKVGLVSMTGIILHNIPEGIATYILSTIDLKLGILLSIAIILHNIPEGICIAIPIYYSIKNKKKVFLYTFISGISEFIGALFSMLFLYKYVNKAIIGVVFSIIAGIMIYIGYYELIITSKKYNNENYKYFCLFGSLFILIVEILLKI